jgi:hypothetical protein
MDDSSDSDQEGLEKVLSDLKGQMASIEVASHELTQHISDLFQRAKLETVDWMNEPLKPRAFVEAWCLQHNVSATPTVNEFIDACFTAASFLDLETRVITFKKEDAEILWKGKRRISIFELISCIPSLFY